MEDSRKYNKKYGGVCRLLLGLQKLLGKEAYFQLIVVLNVCRRPLHKDPV